MGSIPAGPGTIPVPWEAQPPWLESAAEQTVQRMHGAWHRDRANVIDASTKEAAQQVWSLIYGYLRGRVPVPIPPDIAGVSVSAGLRIEKGLSEVGSLILDQGRYNDQVEFRSWSGFLAVERMTLDRYRQRTA